MKHPITTRQKAAFGRYMTKWQGLLNLNDWRILPSSKPADKGNFADVSIYPDDRMATWALGADSGSQKPTPEALERIAIHETLHVLLYPLITAASAHDIPATKAEEHSVIITLEALLYERGK